MAEVAHSFDDSERISRLQMHKRCLFPIRRLTSLPLPSSSASSPIGLGHFSKMGLDSECQSCVDRRLVANGLRTVKITDISHCAASALGA